MPRRNPLVAVDLARDVPRRDVVRVTKRLSTLGIIDGYDALRILTVGPRPGPYWLPKSAVDEVLAA